MRRIVQILVLFVLVLSMSACAAATTPLKADTISTGKAATPYITNPENAYVAFEVFKQAMMSPNVAVYGNGETFMVLMLDPKTPTTVLAAVQYSPKETSRIFLDVFDQSKTLKIYEFLLSQEGYTKTTLTAALTEALAAATNWAAFFTNLSGMEMAPFIIIWPGMPDFYSTDIS